MAELTQPSRELAAKILSDLGWDDKLVGYQMSSHAGNIETYFYGFSEVADFIGMPSFEQLSEKANRAAIGYIDLPELVAWISRVFNDQELVSELEARMVGLESFQQRIEPARVLMQERLRQAREVKADLEKAETAG